MTTSFRSRGAIAEILLGFGVALVGGAAHAQATDDFDTSISTQGAFQLLCGQNLSFGRIYIGASNALATVTLTSGASVSSNQATVAAAGAAVGLCVVTGLQGGDTVTVTLSGGSGTPANGGLTGVTLSDGASHTLTATVQLGTLGTLVSGGRSGLLNAIVPFFGTLTIPANHVDFGTYTTTLTATAALD